jgi:hypothetical protein
MRVACKAHLSPGFFCTDSFGQIQRTSQKKPTKYTKYTNEHRSAVATGFIGYQPLPPVTASGGRDVDHALAGLTASTVFQWRLHGDMIRIKCTCGDL